MNRLIRLMTANFLILSACASPLRKINVIERADQLSSNPEWASVTKPSYEKEGNQYFLGYVEVDGEASKSAALNMADEKALSEPMRSLLEQFLDQNQVGEDLTSSIGQRVISATRGYRPPMPSLHIVKRYWEVVESVHPNTPGLGKIVLRAYSLAEIPTGEYVRAKQVCLAKLAGNSEIKNILSEVGAKQRTKVLTSENRE